MSDVVDFQAAQAARAIAAPPPVELLDVGLGMIDRYVAELGHHTEELFGVQDATCHKILAHADAIRAIAERMRAAREPAQ